MRRLIVIALFVVGIGAIVRFADFRTLADALADMPRVYLALIVTLIVAGAFARAFRWSYYLRSAGLNISWRDGMTSYLASMAACALPASSLLSARLAQEHGNVRMRQATPALFVGYVSDAIALSVLALALSVATRQPLSRFVVPAAGLALAVVLLAMGRSRAVWNGVHRLLGRFRLTRRWQSPEEDIHQRVSALMRLEVVTNGVALSMITTLLSLLLLLAFVNALTVRGITLLEAARVHTTAETVGIVAPIGAGFSISDSSLAGMLNSLGIGWVRVVFILLTMRTFGVLFKTAFGTSVLFACYRPLLFSALALPERARAARRRCGRAWQYSCRSSVVLEWLRLRQPRPRVTGTLTQEPLAVAATVPVPTFPPGAGD